MSAMPALLLNSSGVDDGDGVDRALARQRGPDFLARCEIAQISPRVLCDCHIRRLDQRDGLAGREVKRQRCIPGARHRTEQPIVLVGREIQGEHGRGRNDLAGVEPVEAGTDEMWTSGASG
jgi:hypothetical protein